MWRSGWLAAPLVFSVLTLGPAAAAADPLIRFQVPEPFRLGSRGFAAGVVILRTIASFTPTESILEVWVGSQCLGMMTVHRSVSEEPPRNTEAVFRRDDDGLLEMVGFSVTGRPTGTTYRFP